MQRSYGRIARFTVTPLPPEHNTLSGSLSGELVSL